MKVILYNYMGNPQTVAECARTSTATKQTSKEAEAFCKKLIKKGHFTPLEAVVYTFDIRGVSRALLQEIARYRISSLVVESSRFTLKKKLMKATPVELYDMLYRTTIPYLNQRNVIALLSLQQFLQEYPNTKNDVLKYGLPEAFLTNLKWTLNAHSLRHVFEQRLGREALYEFRQLCREIIEVLPDNHTVFYGDIWEEKTKGE